MVRDLVFEVEDVGKELDGFMEGSRKFRGPPKFTEQYVRHITITDGSHCDYGPPKPVRNGLEVGVRGTSLREINCA